MSKAKSAEWISVPTFLYFVEKFSFTEFGEDREDPASVSIFEIEYVLNVTMLSNTHFLSFRFLTFTKCEG